MHANLHTLTHVHQDDIVINSDIHRGSWACIQTEWAEAHIHFMYRENVLRHTEKAHSEAHTWDAEREHTETHIRMQ